MEWITRKWRDRWKGWRCVSKTKWHALFSKIWIEKKRMFFFTYRALAPGLEQQFETSFLEESQALGPFHGNATSIYFKYTINHRSTNYICCLCFQGNGTHTALRTGAERNLAELDFSFSSVLQSNKVIKSREEKSTTHWQTNLQNLEFHPRLYVLKILNMKRFLKAELWQKLTNIPCKEIQFLSTREFGVVTHFENSFDFCWISSLVWVERWWITNVYNANCEFHNSFSSNSISPQMRSKFFTKVPVAELLHNISRRAITCFRQRNEDRQGQNLADRESELHLKKLQSKQVWKFSTKNEKLPLPKYRTSRVGITETKQNFDFLPRASKQRTTKANKIIAFRVANLSFHRIFYVMQLKNTACA